MHYCGQLKRTPKTVNYHKTAYNSLFLPDGKERILHGQQTHQNPNIINITLQYSKYFDYLKYKHYYCIIQWIVLLILFKWIINGICTFIKARGRWALNIPLTVFLSFFPLHKPQNIKAFRITFAKSLRPTAKAAAPFFLQVSCMSLTFSLRKKWKRHMCEQID